MDNITIQVHGNRKLSKKTVDIGNMQENEVTKLIFELDADIVALGGNVYLFVSYDGASYPYPLTDNVLAIGRELTQRKKTQANVVISTSTDEENPLNGVVWISDTLTLLTDKNSINIDSINEQELPPSLQIVYDKLLNLEKDLKQKSDSDYFRGDDGKTAYEYAAEGGFTGTEEEYAKSMAEAQEYKYTKANAIINTASGSTIVTTDSAKAPPVEFESFGKGTQRTTEGHQLFDKLTAASLGTLSEDGKTVTGQARTSDSYCTLTRVTFDEITLSAGNTHYISTDIKLSSGSLERLNMLMLIDSDGNQLGGTAIVVNPSISSKYQRYAIAITPETDIAIKEFVIQGYIATNAVIEATKFMVSKTSYEWEEYTGGQPSPSTKYPQEVIHAGQSGQISYKFLSGNLINPENFTYNGIKRTLPDIALGNSGFLWLETNFYVTEGQRYFVGYSKDGVWSTEYTHYCNYDVCSSTNVTQIKNGSFVALKSGRLCMRLDGKYGEDHIVDELYMGYVPVTEYEPYIEQPLTIQTPGGFKGIQVTDSSIATYTDNKSGKMFCADDLEMQRIHTQILPVNYIEKLDVNESYGRWLLNVNKLDYKPYMPPSGRTGDIMCNMFMGNTNEARENDGICVTYNGYISMGFDMSKTVEEVKAYFTENPIEITYILAEPIPRELVTEGEITMNHGHNTLINDAGVYMELKYVADTKAYIDNKFKELATSLANTNAQLI